MLAKIEKKLAGVSRRRIIFFYDLLWFLILGVVAWELTQKNNCILPTVPTGKIDWSSVTAYCVLWTKYKLLFNCMWMGALGGVTISLKGIYDHGASTDPWKNDYNLWHIGRPVSGAIAGLIAGLLLYLIVPVDKFSPVLIYGLAFILGMQDKAFFDFLSQIGGRFLPKSDATPPLLQVIGIDPTEGKGGQSIKITGQAIDKNAVLRIGGKTLGTPVIAPDGTSASGTVPLGLAANTKVDVAVINPGGRSIVLVDKFKPLGD
ncbi:MAG: hypothetical protein QOF14_374 [Hyphomicrobiales bacterium]|jgi:hypothetical protein|nr:hypothetical protein [Hyphomicrobiales bacterium]